MGSRYDYICNSEDRPHYDHDDFCLRNFHYPMIAPRVTTINIINKTEVIQEITTEQIVDAVNTIIPDLKAEITDDVISTVGEEGFDEIYGGSASDVMEEDENG